MKIKINQEVEQVIDIECPRYFMSKFTNRKCKLTEEGIVKVNDDYVMFLKYDFECKYFRNEIKEMMEQSVEISKLEFEEKLGQTLKRFTNE